MRFKYLTAFFTLVSLGSEQMGLSWTLISLHEREREKVVSGCQGKKDFHSPGISLAL